MGCADEPQRGGREAKAGRSGHGKTSSGKQTQRETGAGGEDKEMVSCSDRFGGRAYDGYGPVAPSENSD